VVAQVALVDTVLTVILDKLVLMVATVLEDPLEIPEKMEVLDFLDLLEILDVVVPLEDLVPHQCEDNPENLVKTVYLDHQGKVEAQEKLAVMEWMDKKDTPETLDDKVAEDDPVHLEQPEKEAPQEVQESVEPQDEMVNVELPDDKERGENQAEQENQEKVHKMDNLELQEAEENPVVED